MIPRLNIYIWLAIAAIVLLSLGSIYHYIYKSGATSEVTKQENALKNLTEKTDAIQDRALTTPTPSNELRNYARPD